MRPDNWDTFTPAANAVGRVAAVKYTVGAPSATSTVLDLYGYTQFGRLATKKIRYTRGTSKAEFSVPATYDSYGRLAKLTYQGSVRSDSNLHDCEYFYDGLGQPVRMTDTLTPCFVRRVGDPNPPTNLYRETPEEMMAT